MENNFFKIEYYIIRYFIFLSAFKIAKFTKIFIYYDILAVQDITYLN